MNISGIKSFSCKYVVVCQKPESIEIGVNMFQFIFNNRYDMDRILNGRPWVFDNLSLVLLS